MREPDPFSSEALSSEFLKTLPGRFTLIVGEVNSGKTTLTGRILEAYSRTYGGDVVVVDLAPEIRRAESAVGKRAGKVGGRLHVSERVRVFHEKIFAPRLTAKTEQEAEAFARENALTAERIFLRALSAKPEALFINDCSLYLHAGSPETLLGWIRATKTAVVNGYLGKSLGEGRISRREREGMEFLMDRCDWLIRL